MPLPMPEYAIGRDRSDHWSVEVAINDRYLASVG